MLVSWLSYVLWLYTSFIVVIPIWKHYITDLLIDSYKRRIIEEEEAQNNSTGEVDYFSRAKITFLYHLIIKAWKEKKIKELCPK